MSEIIDWSSLPGVVTAKKMTKKITQVVGVYMGSEILTQDGITIYPVIDFLNRLYKGDFF
jgi:hypothetical protein